MANVKRFIVMELHPQIITKNKSPEYAIIPYAEYEYLMELYEDQEDLKAVRDFRENGEETFPLELVQKIANGINPIKVFREYRKISQIDLAKKAGISRQYLSQIESNKRQGNVKLLKKISKLLKVDIDLLISE